MKIRLNTSNVTYAILILQCIPPLFYIKYLFTRGLEPTGLQFCYGMYGALIAVVAAFAVLILFLVFISSLCDGTIKLFPEKEIEIKLPGRKTEKQKEIDKWLIEYGRASMDHNEGRQRYYHALLEENGYFK